MVRIGVFVCHCGQNIAGFLDTSKVIECALSVEGVVHAEELKFACASDGQQRIKEAIQENSLDRVVVAACTPNLHEQTFRKAVEGLINPYLVECVNIREQCSWSHPTYEGATRKACDLVKMGIARAKSLEPLEPRRIRAKKDVLVVGGGVAGITASLELANAGYHVYLVEKESTIGGKMALLDKVFPTGDCSICVLAPKMNDVNTHPNITLLTYSEIESIEGHAGKYRVRVRKKPRFVNEYCKGCIEYCSSVCPIEVPNEFDFGLSRRNAIYKPFPQAVPEYALIDPESCVGCGLCKLACPLDAIVYDQKTEIIEFVVGAIIIATGFKPFDPKIKESYRFEQGRDIITSFQLERMLCASGPTEGRLVQPSTMEVPKKVAFIQCVGSRDAQVGKLYCSRVCCMVSIKNALQIKERYPDTDVVIHYIDIRACGEGYEEMYLRAQKAGVKFVRGLPGELIPMGNGVKVYYEDTLNSRKVEEEYDLVVLSIGMEPSLEPSIKLPLRDDGFVAPAHPKMMPVETVYKGIMVAGCASGPKEIPLSISQAGDCASKVMNLLSRGIIEIEPYVAFVDEERCVGCGICKEVCPSNSIFLVNGKAKIESTTCIACGTCVGSCPTDAIAQKNFTDTQIFAQLEMLDKTSEYPLIVAYLCNWCSYRAVDLAGVLRLKHPPNVRAIRVMCAGRVDPQMIIEAFKHGADGVLVGGCKLGECHYHTGNYQCLGRISALKEIFKEYGIEPERIRTLWISANEAERYVEEVNDFVEELKKLGPLSKKLS
jgi:heterodisulfide reductase subunit A